MSNLIEFGCNEAWQEKAKDYPEWALARVIAQYKGAYKIMTELGECLAEISGKFRYAHTELAEFPAVGDFVFVSNVDSDEQTLIQQVLPRKSSFVRTAVGMKGQSQVVAANMDFVFICMSLNANYNLSRLERYLSIAWDSGATPVIVLTKSDLCENLLQVQDEVFHVAAFTDVVTISMWDMDLSEKFEKYLQPGITATFIGSSGVGKSTLINQLLGKVTLLTSETGKLDKGRHTTTGRELFLLPQGGIVIDTPGMREIGVEHADLSQSFHDIEIFAENCRFKDCGHISEPGCAVRQAVAEGKLDMRRLENFEKIKREAKYDGLSSKQIEEEEMERMFKDFGGVKNVKKMIKSKNRQKGYLR